MLVELAVAEQRLRAVLEVLDGASVTEVARRFGVSRQTVHTWLRRYAGDGGFGNLADRICLQICLRSAPRALFRPLPRRTTVRARTL
jgi:transposase-like protein